MKNLVVFVALLVFLSGCGQNDKTKRIYVYNVELAHVESRLPIKLKADSSAVKTLGKLNKVSSFLFPSFVTKKVVSTFMYVVTDIHYKDGNENFLSLPPGVVFNYVIMDGHMRFVHTGKNFFKDYYSKHFKLSGGSYYVRYAGDFWYDGTKIIITNNSGTYRPPKNTGPFMAELLHINFPHITFEFRDFKHAH